MTTETHQEKRNRLGQHVCLKCGGLAQQIYWINGDNSGHSYRCRKCDNEWPRVLPKRKNTVKGLKQRCEELGQQYQDEAELRLAAESDVYILENYIMKLPCKNPPYDKKSGMRGGYCDKCLPCRVRKQREKKLNEA